MRIVIGVAVMSLVVAACGGDTGPTTSEGPAMPGNIARGADIYRATCAACHGGNAEGVSGLGKPLVDNDFVASRTEEEIAAFIRIGRDKDDPANTTGVPMLPKGGNPSLTEQDLRDVASYLISLNS
jgi:disulfide bond formation protein DsbB